MPGEHEEIGTKLILDDAASEALEHVKEGFEKTKERVHETSHEIAEMAKQAIAFAVGFQLDSAIDSLKEFGEELIHSAVGLENENKELAGVLAMVDKSGKGFTDLANDANELNDRLEQMGMHTGNAKDAMLDAFDMIGERSNMTADQVEDMVGKMAEASKTLPGGLQTMSAAWRDLEVGVVRPKNALVQLIKQMDVAKGSSKDIAKGLNSMIQGGRQEEVFKLAEAAIDRMAKKTRDMPLTFAQTLQSLRTFRESIFETAGTAITGALQTQMRGLGAYLEGHRHEIEEVAKTIGTRVGEWVTKAGEMIKDGFQYLHDHADEILDALEKGGAAIKDAIAFMVAHRDLIMALALTKMGMGALGTGAKLAGLAPELGEIIGKAVGGGLMANLGKALGAAVPGLGMAGRALSGAVAGAGGGLAGVGAVAAPTLLAGVAWAAAAEQMDKLEKDTGLSAMSLAKHLFGVGGSILHAQEAVKNYDAALKQFNTVAANADASGDELADLANKVQRFGEAAVRAGEMTQEALDKILKQEDKAALDASLYQKQIDAMGQVAEGAAMGSLGQVVPRLVSAYRQIGDGHEQAADSYVQKLLRGNMAIVAALGAANVDDAFAKFKKLVSDPLSGKGDAALKLPTINFGPNTIHVTQDFRDQDPDRVAIIFRRDLNRSATDRIGARVSSGFGF